MEPIGTLTTEKYNDWKKKIIGWVQEQNGDKRKMSVNLNTDEDIIQYEQ